MEDEELKKEVTELRLKFEKHLLEHTHMEEMQEIKYSNLVDALQKLTESTQGLVDAWKVADTVQRLGKWFSGFAGFGVLISIIIYFYKLN